MDELKNNSVVDDSEDTIVVITDDEGNEYNYAQEMEFSAGDDRFAILVSIDGDECGCGCEDHEHEHVHEDGDECGCEEVEVILAKIVTGEDGEPEYIEPTEEEFARAQKAYEALMDQMEE